LTLAGLIERGRREAAVHANAEASGVNKRSFFYLFFLSR